MTQQSAKYFTFIRYGTGYDLASRRKNATRESTATLKAWLNEHKKNPYPTKGEKIMLAIITKMTLTQVSACACHVSKKLDLDFCHLKRKRFQNLGGGRTAGAQCKTFVEVVSCRFFFLDLQATFMSNITALV